MELELNKSRINLIAGKEFVTVRSVYVTERGDGRVTARLDRFYDSPPPKTAIFFNERFRAARHKQRHY